MFNNIYKAFTVFVFSFCIISTSTLVISCSKKSEENSHSSNINNTTKTTNSSEERTLTKEIRNNNLLKMVVVNSSFFNSYLEKIQTDQSSKSLKYFIQDGQIFDFSENKLDVNRPTCSFGLYKRKYTSDFEVLYFKYISENGNKLVAINNGVSVSFSCFLFSAKSYLITLDDLNSIFRNILQFSLTQNLELKQNNNLKYCGDKSNFNSVDQMIADCDERKITISGSIWKLISRSKNGLETWLSPSGNYWTANLGRNSLIQETSSDLSVCKNNSLNTFGLANLNQNEKPLVFDLPTMQDYNTAIKEGLNEVVQNNNTSDLANSLHIYWVKSEGLRYYVYKFLKNSIEEYQWVNKQWNIRCVGKISESTVNQSPNTSINLRKTLINNLPTKQLVIKINHTIKESQLLNKNYFQAGDLLKEKSLQKNLSYCKMVSQVELSKDYTFSIFLNKENVGTNNTKIELSSISNRIVIHCIKSQGEGFTVSDLDEIFGNNFEVIIPYTYTN